MRLKNTVEESELKEPPEKSALYNRCNVSYISNVFNESNGSNISNVSMISLMSLMSLMYLMSLMFLMYLMSWMRCSPVLRGSAWQCVQCNSPSFDPTVHRHEVLKTVHKK
jgi:hypothetical protein